MKNPNIPGQLDIPAQSLVLLLGASSSGKSTFARQHFLPTEIVSSDFCRALIADHENALHVNADAFDLLHLIVAKRLKQGKLTVVDATNVQPEARKALIALARQYHVLLAAIVLNLPEKLLLERHAQRSDRDFGAHVIRNQRRDLLRSLSALRREGFRFTYILDNPEAIAEVNIRRTPAWSDRSSVQGPFDIIGDVHGCFDELQLLLEKMDYRVERQDPLLDYGFKVTPPPGRQAIFVGDLVDRGPKSPEVLRLVMSMVKNQQAWCVPGNHDDKLLRKLQGKDVQVRHGLAETLAQLADEPLEFVQEVRRFLDGLISHLVFDEGKLVVAHAGLREDMQGRASRAVRAFCLYGETTGETDEFGLPVRYNWAAEYQGKAMVVFGHTPVPDPEWLNNTIDIDTGCVFGGRLTALRYPERSLITVPALREYYTPSRPIQRSTTTMSVSAQHAHDDMLDMADVSGRRFVETRYGKRILIKEENAIAALEVMSRFAIHPKWLIYLPPTMSPSETSALPDLLEHPAEGFAFYQKLGVKEVICEEKHMGSRAVVIVCQTPEVATTRFGLLQATWGVCYTRTGRAFFDDKGLESAFLQRINAALSAAGFWEKHETDWVCLDCELMPWSAKAQELLKGQYASLQAAGKASMEALQNAFALATPRHLPLEELQTRYGARARAIERYTQAYRNYCHPVQGLQGLVLAPFHILATEGKVHAEQDHLWHLQEIAGFCAADPELLLATPYRLVDLEDAASVQAATEWWMELTERGQEGMVIKPRQFLTRNEEGFVQPAIKCRGREYLRIIYGPEYDHPEQIIKLKSRGLHHKRSLAIREFTLGLEGLERFVAKEPLRKTHECVFGVLALESEEVDPRL
jgi:protein phosphatase